jgi:hypothetical protein
MLSSPSSAVFYTSPCARYCTQAHEQIQHAPVLDRRNMVPLFFIPEPVKRIMDFQPPAGRKNPNWTFSPDSGYIDSMKV